MRERPVAMDKMCQHKATKRINRHRPTVFTGTELMTPQPGTQLLRFNMYFYREPTPSGEAFEKQVFEVDRDLENDNDSGTNSGMVLLSCCCLAVSLLCRDIRCDV